MARATVAPWRITKNDGTARQRFSSCEAFAKKNLGAESGGYFPHAIVSLLRPMGAKRAQNLTNSSKIETMYLEWLGIEFDASFFDNPFEGIYFFSYA